MAGGREAMTSTNLPEPGSNLAAEIADSNDDLVIFARSQRRARGSRLALYVVSGIGVCLLLFPVVMGLAASVLTGAPGADDIGLSLDGWRAAYSEEKTYQAFTDSARIALGSVVAAVSFGTLLAWLVSRTNIPGRGLFRTALILPLFIPTVLVGLAWTVGVSKLSRETKGAPVLSWMIPEPYSSTGVIVALTIAVVPLVFLLMLPAFDAMDSQLEDSATANGVAPWRTTMGISLPLVFPALIGAGTLVAVRVLETLDIPLMIGRPAGVEVFATRMYHSVFVAPVPDYAKAGALGVSLAAVAAIFVALGVIYVNRRSFVTVGGRGTGNRSIDLGCLRFVGSGICWLYLAIGSIVPVGIVVYGSFEGFVGTWDGDLTLAHWQAVLDDRLFWESVRNTLVIAMFGAVIMTCLGAAAAYAVVRSGSRLRFVVEGVTWMPWAVPGILLALGILWGYTLVGNLYGTRWLLIIAYVTIYLPLTVRQFASAFRQLDPALEHAGWLSGSSRPVTFWRLIRPLLTQTTLASLLLGFVLCVREVSVSSFLASPGNEVLGARTLERWTVGAASEATVYGVCMLIISGLALTAYGLLSRRSRRF